MDAPSDPAQNILTRRANHGHNSIIAQFFKPPMALPNGPSSAMTGQKSRQLKLRRLGTREPSVTR
jgi:hypothetical protein